MADDLQNFFDSAAPAGDPVPANKPERKKRTPRTPDKAADAAAAPPKKRGRKPKENGTAMSKIDVAVAVSVFAGLTAEEGAMVAKAAGVLAAMPKGSRSRIVSALSRLFA